MADNNRAAQKPIRARGSNKCADHPGKEVVFVCKDCDGNLACITCVGTTHNKHSLEELTDVISDIKAKIQDAVKDMEQKDIPKLRSELTFVDKKISENTADLTKAVTDIQSRNENLKKDLDTVTENLVSLCGDIAEHINEMLEKYKKDISSKITKLESKMQELKVKLSTGTNVQIYDISSEMPSISNIAHMPPTETITFIPGPGIEQLKQLVGEISISTRDTKVFTTHSTASQMHEDTSQQQETKQVIYPTQAAMPLDVNPLYPSNVNYVESWGVEAQFKLNDAIGDIYPTAGDKVFLRGNDNFYLVNSKGILEQILKMDAEVTDFCVPQSTGEILFCSRKDKSIRKVTGQSSTVMFHVKHKPHSICTANDGSVLVGMDSNITKFTSTGRVLCESQAGGWFTASGVRYPRYISQCGITENVAVADSDEESRGGYDNPHVSILNDKLQLLHVFTRTSPEGQPLRFSPSCVKYDNEGNILVADGESKSIFKLSNTGQIKQSIHRDTAKPICLCVHRDGKIWAVFGGKSLKIFKKY